MRVALYGRGGKVGRVLAPALEAAGHELVELDSADALVDFTAPDAVEANVAAALEHGVPAVIGTTGFDHARIDALPCGLCGKLALGQLRAGRGTGVSRRASHDVPAAAGGGD